MKKEAVERMKNSAEYYSGQERIYEFGFHDGYNFRKLNKSKLWTSWLNFRNGIYQEPLIMEK